MFGREHTDLQPLVNEYLLALRLEGRAETTRRSYAYTLNRLARHLASRRHLSAKTVSAYLAELADMGISRGSLSTYTIILRRFFEWAIGQGRLKDNPLAGIRVHAQPWHPVAPFSDEEIKRLVEASKEPMERAVVLLLLDCGLRASELTGMRLEDIDLKTGELQIRGKGGKERRVALNLKPRQALLAHLSSRTQVDGLLWPKGWNRRMLAAMLDRVARRAGVSRVFPHRFRHTFATRLLAETGDGLALKKLLGHESMTMVLRYTESREEDRALEVHKKHSLVAR